MHQFDYSFLKNFSLPNDLTNYFREVFIGNEKEKGYKDKFSTAFAKLEKMAMFQSVRDSNAIEGIFSTDKRIKQIVFENTDPLNHDEVEIEGYKNALNLIHSNPNALDFRERDILYLHSVMCETTAHNTAGQYKDVDNVIVNSARQIIWEPTSALATPNAMSDLYDAFIIARSDSKINNLLLIPCVILDFLCVHPFSDGNGRMSRLITNLLLYQVGFDVQKYISFESIINDYKNSYYAALEESSFGWHDNQNDYLPFIKNFLFTLYMCFNELNKRFLTVKSGKGAKQKEIEDLVMQSLVPISKEQICSLLFNVSPHTVSAVLYNLLEEGKIIRIGNTKGAKYINKELEDRYK